MDQMKKREPEVLVDRTLLSQQPFWQEIVGSAQVFPIILINVQFHSSQKRVQVQSLSPLAHWKGSVTLKGTRPQHVLSVTLVFSSNVLSI